MFGIRDSAVASRREEAKDLVPAANGRQEVSDQLRAVGEEALPIADYSALIEAVKAEEIATPDYSALVEAVDKDAKRNDLSTALAYLAESIGSGEGPGAGSAKAIRKIQEERKGRLATKQALQLAQLGVETETAKETRIALRALRLARTTAKTEAEQEAIDRRIETLSKAGELLPEAETPSEIQKLLTNIEQLTAAGQGDSQMVADLQARVAKLTQLAKKSNPTWATIAAPIIEKMLKGETLTQPEKDVYDDLMGVKYWDKMISPMLPGS